MHENEWLAERFEEHRTHLRAVAYRMLGSLSDADDAVQEGWLRLSRADTSTVENLGGWLTTVVASVGACSFSPDGRSTAVIVVIDESDGPTASPRIHLGLIELR